jgi:exportin-5
MQQIPNLVISDLHKLDEKILNGTNPLANSNQSFATAQPIPAPSTAKSSKIDKNKKDLFKKITSHLVGRSIGQLFRKEVVIRDLPRPAAVRKMINNNLLEQAGDTGVSDLFTP